VQLQVEFTFPLHKIRRVLLKVFEELVAGRELHFGTAFEVLESCEAL
jgi:hypothetical protein